MSSSKRKFSTNEPISPPSLRRKVQSTTTQNAVSSFFTPTSKKPPEKIIWHERGVDDNTSPTLIVGKYQPSSSSHDSSGRKRRKVAAFDFDSTLIQTSSGKKFASDSSDWKWWHPSVPATLRKLYQEDGFRVVVISNQGGISLKPDTKAPKSHQTKHAAFKAKVSAVFSQLDIPISIYAATEKDIFRKPRTGMWKELLEDYDIHLPGDLDLAQSIFIGDAGGRQADGGKPKDFSCSDRNFADNIGLTFHTPEEFFLQEKPRPFVRSFNPSEYLPTSAGAPIAYIKVNVKDIVLLCGSPGAGKSTFFWRQLEPLGYARVNQDILKTRDKCLRVAEEYLNEGKSVAVDNTNPDIDVRSIWIKLAAKHAVPIRCVLLTTATAICEHNNVVRALNNVMNPEKRTILPGLAFKGFSSRYQQPILSEGFQDITEVEFKFVGNEMERDVWSQHWT